jgi:hypothetical protein
MDHATASRVVLSAIDLVRRRLRRHERPIYNPNWRPEHHRDWLASRADTHCSGCIKGICAHMTIPEGSRPLVCALLGGLVGPMPSEAISHLNRRTSVGV